MQDQALQLPSESDNFAIYKPTDGSWMPRLVPIVKGHPQFKQEGLDLNNI